TRSNAPTLHRPATSLRLTAVESSFVARVVRVAQRAELEAQCKAGSGGREVQVGHLGHPAQAVAQGVRVDAQRLRGALRVAEVVEPRGEGLQERRAVPLVMGAQARQRAAEETLPDPGRPPGA